MLRMPNYLTDIQALEVKTKTAFYPGHLQKINVLSKAQLLQHVLPY